MDVTVKKFNLQKNLPNNNRGHEFSVRGNVFKNTKAQSKFTKCKCQRNRPIFLELPRIVDGIVLTCANEIKYCMTGGTLFT